MKTAEQRNRGGQGPKKTTNPVRLIDLSAKSRLWSEWIGLVREGSGRELGEADCHNPACRHRERFCSLLKG